MSGRGAAGDTGYNRIKGVWLMERRSFGVAATLVLGLVLASCAPSAPNTDSVAASDSTTATVTNDTLPNTSPPSTVPPSTGGPTPGVRNSAIVPGRAARVFIFAGVDKDCASLPEPQLTVTKPPTKGDVSFRPGQATKLVATASGTCIGTKATGTGVYYTAREGTSGADSFSVTARLASGETMTRDFDIKISE